MNNQLFLAVIAVASILLTVNGTKTKSKAELTHPDHGHCNLLKDQADEYYELVFEYKNFVEDLDGMADRVLSIPGVVKSQETTRIYYNSNHIRFQMNRAAYYIVSEIAMLLVILKKDIIVLYRHALIQKSNQ